MKKLNVKINQSIVSILGRKLYQSEFANVVLRELIQNSLDASSTKIDIIFSDNELIVSDNGTGIEKIEGLLDTIGESIKTDDLETIGGYGLAKLAIFGCKTWKFISKSGSFSTGYFYDENEKLLSGTMVSCRFSNADLPYSFYSQIKSYCASILRKTEFTLNGEPIEKTAYTSCFFGSSSEILADTRNNGHVVVRVNGLPTFSEYINNLDKTIFFDYTVTCSPYDNGYPLTSNRDGFIRSSSEYADFITRKKSIELKLESDKKLAENIAKQEKTTTFRNKKYISGGNVSLDDYKNHATMISTWERYIRQIADKCGYDISECNYGLSDGTQELAAYNPDCKAFWISVSASEDKGYILSLALHEFTHLCGYGMYGHDQSYASKLTDVTGIIMNSVFSGEFRK